MLQLGERVRVLAVSRKIHTLKNNTRWERTELKQPLKGIVCGYRVMAEGYTTDWGGGDREFRREGSVRTYLVATSLRSMVTARIEDVQPLAGEKGAPE